jgi:hypothetical protein
MCGYFLESRCCINLLSPVSTRCVFGGKWSEEFQALWSQLYLKVMPQTKTPVRMSVSRKQKAPNAGGNVEEKNPYVLLVGITISPAIIEMSSLVP